MALDNYPVLQSAQIKKGWDTRLRAQGSLRDWMTSTKGVYREKGGAANTNSFITTVSPASGEITRTINLVQDLVGEGVYGKRQLLGNEEQQVTRAFNVYMDECAHGVPFEAYGYKAHERNPYGFIPMIHTQLSEWHKKNEGRRIRQALCEGYDGNLTGAYTNTGLSSSNAYPHSNIFMTGVSAASQPEFSATIATYADAVNDLVSSYSLPSTIYFLDQLAEWAINDKNLRPYNTPDGKGMYIYSCPTQMYTRIKQFWNEYYKGSGNSAGLGALGLVHDNLIIVEDSKAPRVTITSSTLSFSYNGVVDGRAAAAAGVADCGQLWGGEALFEFSGAQLEYRKDVTNYERDGGIGAFKMNGFNRPDWDVTLGTKADTRKNYTSALVLSPSV